MSTWNWTPRARRIGTGLLWLSWLAVSTGVAWFGVTYWN